MNSYIITINKQMYGIGGSQFSFTLVGAGSQFSHAWDWRSEAASLTSPRSSRAAECEEILPRVFILVLVLGEAVSTTISEVLSSGFGQGFLVATTMRTRAFWSCGNQANVRVSTFGIGVSPSGCFCLFLHVCLSCCVLFVSSFIVFVAFLQIFGLYVFLVYSITAVTKFKIQYKSSHVTKKKKCMSKNHRISRNLTVLNFINRLHLYD